MTTSEFLSPRPSTRLRVNAPIVTNVPAISDLRLELDRRKCRRLVEFVKMAWPIVEPGTPYVHGWHIEAICEHLEAVTRGEIKRLIINIPPRTCKSTLVSVLWPCWEWTENPEHRYVCSSYSGILSTRDTLRSRRLITSTWYQERWGDRVTLSKDQQQKTRFENTATGSRIASSVGGTMTGEGGSRLILDDPHAALEAQSDTIREGVLDWFSSTISTRLNNPKTDAIVLVMQRLHDQDLTGFLLSQKLDYEHLCLPMEYDGQRSKTSLGFKDPRTQKGELLWPEQFGAEQVAGLKKALGIYGASGQLQQDPSPAEGGIIKTKFIKLWPSESRLPAFKFILQSYDGAFTEETRNDPSGLLVLGIFEHKEKNYVMLLDAWEERLEYPELRRKAKEEYGSFYGEEYGGQRKTDCVLIEDKGSGTSLRQDLQRSGVPCRPYNPGKASKEMRAHLIAPLIEAGLFYVMESPNNKGKPVTWAEWAFKEWKLFPNAKHDEAVDTLTQGLIYLRDAGFITIDVNDDEEVYADDRPRKIRNPYLS